MNRDGTSDSILTEGLEGGESAPVGPSGPSAHQPDVPLENLVRFETVAIVSRVASLPEAPTESEASVTSALFTEPPTSADIDKPDVLLEELIQFERAPLPAQNGALDELLRDADDFAAEARPAFRKAVVREWSESLAMVLAFILVFTGYVAQATQVPTESMKPTILVGDHFFIEKVAFPGNYPAAVRPYLPERAIRRGDIVVFRSPVDGKIPFVKRVIGTPGDRVEIRKKAVFVNGVELDEPYKIHVDQTVYSDDAFTPESWKKRDNYGPMVIPADSFFVMGDNRDNSNDSRYWGFVGRDAIMGMPLFVYWSYRSDPYSGSPPTVADRFNDYVQTGIHFFSRTRWFRFGTLVQ